MQGKRGIVFAGLVPHPPIIVPEVGGRHLATVEQTVAAMRDLASRLANARPATLVIISPHGATSRRAFVALSGSLLRGNLSEFGAPGVSLEVQADGDLLRTLTDEAARRELPLVTAGSRSELHYAFLVPLLYLRAAGFRGRVLALTSPYDLALTDCYRFGQAIESVAAAAGQPIAVIASGDLSHRLQPSAPGGYDPRGAAFDREVVRAIAAVDYRSLLAVDDDLADGAGECGLRPLVTMLGAIASSPALEPQVLSYEGPFGVGYAVAAFEAREGGAQTADSGAAAATADPISHPLVALAREAIETYVRAGTVLPTPERPPAPDQPAAAGAFVSLYLRGELRGCIGTITPTHPTVAEEVIRNAIAAASEDPRFVPVDSAELAELAVSVDVLGPAEPTVGLADLDPRIFGVIVEKGSRRGLLLPDLDGVDTAEEQVAIAARKAGLNPRDPGLRLSRFRVERLR